MPAPGALRIRNRIYVDLTGMLRNQQNVTRMLQNVHRRQLGCRVLPVVCRYCPWYAGVPYRSTPPGCRTAQHRRGAVYRRTARVPYTAVQPGCRARYTPPGCQGAVPAIHRRGAREGTRYPSPYTARAPPGIAWTPLARAPYCLLGTPRSYPPPGRYHLRTPAARPQPETRPWALGPK